MATLLERLLSPLARGEAMQTWPPPAVKDHWEEVQGYRRRFSNKKSDRLPYATEFSRTAYGKQIYTPVGVAREVCNFSADLLFSAPPTITFESDPDLLEEIIEGNRLLSRLPAMASPIAAEGAGGLRIIADTDENTPNIPLITRVREDEVIWDIRHGDWVAGGAVVIERQNRDRNGVSTDVYRLVEEHTRGKVLRRLFRGTATMIGSEVALNTLNEFANLPEEEDTGLDAPTLVRWENVSGGYSDLAGAEAILDRIDAEVSYGVEKSEKSRPVSFAPASMFDERGRVDLSGIIPIRKGRMRDLEESDMAKNFGTIQPDFLADEIIAWVDFLLDTALLTMGYSKASYGRDQGGSADSGKALKLRQSRTLLKKAGKDRMAKDALIQALAVAMAWEDGGSSVADYRPEIELGDGTPRDTLEEAQEATIWGDAISLEEKIRMRRPDWDDDAVTEEVARIKSENAAPTMGMPSLNLESTSLEERNGNG